MKHPFRNFFLFLILPSLVFASFYRFRNEKRQAVVNEEYVVVKRGDVIVKAAETGSLEPLSIVEIKSEQSGEVKQLLVATGDAIQAGDPLATIQQESNQARRVAEARVAIEQERLNLEESHRELKRIGELFAKGFVARQELEHAEKTDINAKIKYDLSKRQLLLTLGGNKQLFEQTMSRDLTSDEVDDFTIYAPVSGTVIEVKTSQGEIVSSGTSTVTGGTTLMRIADLSRMLVKTMINEVNIGQIKVGQPVEIKLDAIPDHVYVGKVSSISPTGEKEKNLVTYLVTIELINSDQRLKPSMTADVDIITHRAKEALYLPLIAFIETDGQQTVRVRGPNGDRTQAVSTGIKNETVAVITDGLKKGDEVILPTPKSASGRSR